MQYLNNLLTNQYLTVLICMSFSLVLALIIFGLSYFLGVQNPDAEKISAYECGFEPFEDARNKFDVRFYIVAILFIIFDVEVIYLFPWSVSLYITSFESFWIVTLFLIILIIGFLYEVAKHALDWQ